MAKRRLSPAPPRSRPETLARGFGDPLASCDALPRRDVDVAAPLGAGSTPEEQLLAVLRERRSRLRRGRVHDRAEIHRGRPRRADVPRVATQMSCAPSVPDRFEQKTSSRPSARTFGWMSFALASFSSLTAVAGPKRAPFCRSLTKISPGTFGVTELREKYRSFRPRSLPAATHEGPCSSSSLFGPAGAQSSRSGSLQAPAPVRWV